MHGWASYWKTDELGRYVLGQPHFIFRKEEAMAMLIHGASLDSEHNWGTMPPTYACRSRLISRQMDVQASGGL
jgi:hypothetical protein